MSRCELVDPAISPGCMAAFGHTLNSSRIRTCVSRQQPCSCSHLQPPARVQVARQRNSLTPAVPLSRLPTHHKRRALSTWRHAIQANAAGDIALPAPSGHAESVRVPESGLLKSSWLKCRHDSEIFGLAIPALGSILLDPLLSLVDTGKLMVFGTVFAKLCLYLHLHEKCMLCLPQLTIQLLLVIMQHLLVGLDQLL